MQIWALRKEVIWGRSLLSEETSTCLQIKIRDHWIKQCYIMEPLLKLPHLTDTLSQSQWSPSLILPRNLIISTRRLRLSEYPSAPLQGFIRPQVSLSRVHFAIRVTIEMSESISQLVSKNYAQLTISIERSRICSLCKPRTCIPNTIGYKHLTALSISPSTWGTLWRETLTKIVNPWES
jgi:hypothetical protein